MPFTEPHAYTSWHESTEMSFLSGDADREDDHLDDQGAEYNDGDMRTPLDRTIDRIGMGRYQWTLFVLCGFGWMADNMWIQAVALILPRVQQHYDVHDAHIGLVSSTMFAGMMCGAAGWGTCSDLMGRTIAFNVTLSFTAVFGLLASLADSFSALCILFFLLGSAVGGSLPTDGTLLLEHLPQGKRWLLTALSVFFSLGAAIAAGVALAALPYNSCAPAPAQCDLASENGGWKYMLVGLGLITLSMFLARILLFRLYESPRYLVHAGRTQAALESLRGIARFNGADLDIDLDDVRDGASYACGPITGTEYTAAPQSPAAAGFANEGAGDTDVELQPTSPGLLARHPPHATNVPEAAELESATDASLLGTAGLGSPSAAPPRPQRRPQSLGTLNSSRQSHRAPSRRQPSLPTVQEEVSNVQPQWFVRPLRAWYERIATVLSPEWARTTLLIWCVWFSVSLAYTTFNVFLPKMLEARGQLAETKSLQGTLWDVAVFTLGGCPGALIGAYMVESRLGQRWSLAGSTFAAALFSVLFVCANSAVLTTVSSVGISLSTTVMYAVLYGWTPELFGTEVRGTACGIASALSRIGGMVAPMLGGVLLVLDQAFPVYASIAMFVFASACVFMLRETGPGGKGAPMVIH